MADLQEFAQTRLELDRAVKQEKLALLTKEEDDEKEQHNTNDNDGDIVIRLD